MFEPIFTWVDVIIAIIVLGVCYTLAGFLVDEYRKQEGCREAPAPDASEPEPSTPE